MTLDFTLLFFSPITLVASIDDHHHHHHHHFIVKEEREHAKISCSSSDGEMESERRLVSNFALRMSLSQAKDDGPVFSNGYCFE